MYKILLAQLRIVRCVLSGKVFRNSNTLRKFGSVFVWWVLIFVDFNFGGGLIYEQMHYVQSQVVRSLYNA